MRPKKDLLRWLRILTSDDAYMSTVLRYGDWFFGRANVAEYEAAELWQSRRRPRAGHCFYNAQTYCIDHREATYWEGYFLIRGLPIHHGWVVMEDGRVVDFTIEAVIRKLIRERKPVDETIPLYLGINVPQGTAAYRPLLQAPGATIRRRPSKSKQAEKLVRFERFGQSGSLIQSKVRVVS